MELTSILIIYFALGVPFGVLSSYLRSSRVEAADLARVIYHLAFWPFIAVVRALRPVVDRGSIIASDTNVERRGNAVDPSELSLRRRIRSHEAMVEGLGRALRTFGSAAELRLPFLDCIESSNPRLAAKCFQRRNIAKLERHIAEARRELSRSLAELPTESAEPIPSGLEQTVREMC